MYTFKSYIEQLNCMISFFEHEFRLISEEGLTQGGKFPLPWSDSLDMKEWNDAMEQEDQTDQRSN